MKGKALTPQAASLIKWASTWFGCGLAPVAPGTFGTLGAIPLVWLFGLYGDIAYIIASIIFIALGILIAQIYEDTLAEAHDPSEFVLDEVAGFLVTMALVPFTWMHLLAGFLLFRLFDVLKPWPISYIDREMQGGIGAMCDDLVAGFLASVVMQALLHWGWL